MPQKSRNVAARYAAQSKDRRAKKRASSPAVEEMPRPVAPIEAVPTRPAAPAKAPVVAPTAQRMTKFRSTTQIIAGNYDYVTEDLRQIGVISLALLAIIVGLTFVLH